MVEPLKRVTKILCPACKASGTVIWQKTSLQARTIEYLTRGFVSIDRGNDGDPHCECATCRITVVSSEIGPQGHDALR